MKNYENEFMEFMNELDEKIENGNKLAALLKLDFLLLDMEEKIGLTENGKVSLLW